MIEQRLWTVADLAAFLGVTEGAVWSMRKRKEIPPSCVVKIGRRVRFTPNAVRAWLGVETQK